MENYFLILAVLYVVAQYLFIVIMHRRDKKWLELNEVLNESLIKSHDASAKRNQNYLDSISTMDMELRQTYNEQRLLDDHLYIADSLQIKKKRAEFKAKSDDSGKE